MCVARLVSRASRQGSLLSYQLTFAGLTPEGSLRSAVSLCL